MRPAIRWLLYFYYDTHCVMGSGGALQIGKKVATSNTLFNVSSGSIIVGDYTIFGQNVMVLTGRHRFTGGKRAGLKEAMSGGSWGGGCQEVPCSGFDIKIGSGCWIASGAIISGGVTIGENAIIAAGSVITRDVADHCIVAGIPGKPIGDTRQIEH